MLKFQDLHIDTGGKASGRIKVKCPQCQGTRKKNKHDTPLSVDLDNGLWLCHHCSWSGSLKAHERYEKVRERAAMPTQEIVYSAQFMSFWKAKCITEETLRLKFVYERKVWMPGCRDGENVPVTCFPYFKNYNLVNTKFRQLSSKNFRQIKKEDGAEKVFWGLDSIVEKKPVLICEGEPDLLTLVQVGYKSVLSVPEGAPNEGTENMEKKMSYLDEYVIEKLQSIPTIYLCCDDDAPGITLRNELARRLGRERCKIVYYPEGCKDINDVLKQWDSDKVISCIENAKPYPVAGIIKVSDVDRELNELREKGFERGLLIGNKKVDRLWSIKPKLFTLITGHSGGGKTTWLDWYLVELIKNNPKEHIHVCYYSPENRPVSRGMSKIAEKYIKKDFGLKDRNSMSDEEFRHAKMWINRHFTFIMPDNREKNLVLYGKKMKGVNTVESILELSKVVIQQEGANFIVLDPWNKIEHNKDYKESETDYISRNLDLMFELADNYDCHVVLIAHPTKGQGGKLEGNMKRATLNDVSGSAAWKNKPDTGIIIHRDKYQTDKETEKTVYDRFAPTQIHVEKQRFEEVGEEGFCKMYRDENKGRIFVSSLKDLEKPKGKKDQEKLSTKLDQQAEEDANSDLPF